MSPDSYLATSHAGRASSFSPARAAGCSERAEAQHVDAEGAEAEGAEVAQSEVGQGPLNRLRAVRQQQGLALRTISRRSRVAVTQLRAEEEPTADLPVSVVYRWQRALDVPLSELLVEPDEALSIVVNERAKLLRVMKTALSLCETARDEQGRRLAAMLCQQLSDLMPELAEQTAWPSVGSRRGHDDLGRIAERPFRVDPPQEP